MHKVVVPFPFYANGITPVDLVVGDERDFGAMADGLVAIGWIEAIADPADVEQPADIEQPVFIPVIETTALAGAPENATLKRGRRR